MSSESVLEGIEKDRYEILYHLSTCLNEEESSRRDRGNAALHATGTEDEYMRRHSKT
jgi:hypothetical protein